MIRHCVMFRFAPGTTSDQVAAVGDALSKLPDAIPEIAAYSFGLDAGLSDGNLDYVVVGDFASAADYEVYAKHPAHVQMIADIIKPVLAERAAVQYQL